MINSNRIFVNNSNSSDVTIKEFADSDTSTNRSKKGTLEVREKMFDVTVNVFTENDDDDRKRVNQIVKPKPDNPSDDHVYSSYPVDIWFLIAQHISPEDVGRFSLICRTTASVCATPGFWFSLYKRFYRSFHARTMPVRLQPDCMVRLHGLRACVIRSLFFTYKPFVDRLPALVRQDFHNLKSYWVVSSWVAPDKNDWTFCYKLRSNMPTLADSSESSGRSLNNFRDIFFNPEKGCKVLIVSLAFQFFDPIHI